MDLWLFPIYQTRAGLFEFQLESGHPPRHEAFKNLHPIKDSGTFEVIAERYFKEYFLLCKVASDVQSRRAGVGQDGGRDVLVEYIINTPSGRIVYTLVIQAKLHKKRIGPSHFSDKTSPSIVAHRYHADMYIFITSGELTEGFKQCFDELDKNPRYKCRFCAWDGAEFAFNIEKSGADWMGQYSPEWAEKITQVITSNNEKRKM